MNDNLIMKITIDTKEDSHEDIIKVIKMLQHLVGEPSYSNQPNIFEDNTPVQTETGNAFANMFGDGARETKEEPMDKEEEKEDIPEVIPY